MKANFQQEEEPFEWGGLHELAAGEYELRLEPSLKMVFAALAGGDERAYETVKAEAKKLFAQRGATLNSGAQIRPAFKRMTLAFDEPIATYACSAIWRALFNYSLG